MNYAHSIERKKTKKIKLGNVEIGGDAPIAVQTMTNTLTHDIDATLKQISEIENEGCDIVRVSIPDEPSSKALKSIIPHMKIPFTNYFQESPYDYSKFLLTSFFLIFSIVILFFSSFNIYNKFNNQVGIKNFEKDKIYEDILNFISKNNLENINDKDFIDLLVPLKRTNYSQTFVIQTNNLGPIYYKIKYIDKKTILFGELLQLNKIELDLNNDFLIDLSNIANIDKITYRGIEIKLKNNYQFYLKDFNINELETLL